MKETTFKVNGLSIAAKLWGDPSKKPLLALHGWLDNASSFDLLAPKLEKHYYIVAIDLPGHGLSSHLPDFSVYHFIDSIFYVDQLVAHLGWKRYSLLGHSLGAGIASLVSGITPHAIENSFLIDALGAFSAPPSSITTQIQQYLHCKEHMKSANFYPTLDAAIVARAKYGRVDKASATILAERSVEQLGGRFRWRHDPRLLLPSPLQLTERQVVSILKQITAQTMLMIPERGFPFDPEMVARRCAAVPQLNKISVPGGHHCHMEHPDSIANSILSLS